MHSPQKRNKWQKNILLSIFIGQLSPWKIAETFLDKQSQKNNSTKEKQKRVIPKENWKRERKDTWIPLNSRLKRGGKIKQQKLEIVSKTHVDHKKRRGEEKIRGKGSNPEEGRVCWVQQISLDPSRQVGPQNFHHIPQNVKDPIGLFLIVLVWQNVTKGKGRRGKKVIFDLPVSRGSVLNSATEN